MDHELLWSVLNAQRANATLSGGELRAAAQDLAHIWSTTRSVLMAFDAVGERIIGAAMAISGQSLEVFDYTGPFPDRATCLLVGGTIAGPVGIVEAAAAVTRAGARRVEAAIIRGWPEPIPGVVRIRQIGESHADVA